MRNYSRIIVARFSSTCGETGLPISKGDTCLYCPDSRTVYHERSDTMRRFQSSRISEETFTPQYC